jgi:hypothetical protein
MPKAICLSLAFIATAVCVRFLLWSPSTREIEFVPAVIDLGEVREEQRLKTEFRIRNNAKVPYRVVNLVATCRCTANELTWPQTLEPGETLAVPVEYHTGRGDGILKQRLVVLLERADQRGTLAYAKPIEVFCRVMPELRAIPQILDFGSFGPDDQAKSLFFHIESVGGQTYRIESVEVTAAQVDVEHPGMIGPLGAEFQVRFNPADIFANRSIKGILKLGLSGGIVESFSVPFRGQVSPAFVVTPDVLVFDARSQVGSILSLTLRGCEPFRVAEVRFPDSVAVQDQPRNYALSHQLPIVLTEIRNGAFGELQISIVGESGRSANVLVRVGRISDGIGEE